MSKLNSKKSVFSNPLIRKMKQFEGVYDDSCATYKGIFKKSLYFVVMVLVGVAFALALATPSMIAGILPLLVMGVALLAMIVCAIVSAVAPKTTPVTGTIGSIAMGYLVAFPGALIREYSSEYSSIYYLALVLTIAIVLAMMFVYFSGIVKVTNTFRKVLYSVLFASIFGSLFLTICYFIPATRIATALFITNPMISILCSVAGVVLASLFLLIDFNDIERTVKARFPKEYEWYAAYSLIITVVWLYLEILDLLLKIKDLTD